MSAVTDPCAICRESLSQNPVSLLACTHNFHKACLETSLETSIKCPECRAEVVVLEPTKALVEQLESCARAARHALSSQRGAQPSPRVKRRMQKLPHLGIVLQNSLTPRTPSARTPASTYDEGDSSGDEGVPSSSAPITPRSPHPDARIHFRPLRSERYPLPPSPLSPAPRADEWEGEEPPRSQSFLSSLTTLPGGAVAGSAAAAFTYALSPVLATAAVVGFTTAAFFWACGLRRSPF